MERHVDEKFRALKEKLIAMGRLAQEMIEDAIDGLLADDIRFADRVFAKEKAVNHLEIEIDMQGHTLLALAQPVAFDLRMLTTVLKINTDLERIADHAVNIAERVKSIEGKPRFHFETALSEMSAAVREILNDAVASFVSADEALANRVLKKDDEIDASNHALCAEVENWIEKTPQFARTGMRLARIGHELERIGDLSNNIAENVVYMKRGKEVRHNIAK